jgi:hypothetical protein
MLWNFFKGKKKKKKEKNSVDIGVVLGNDDIINENFVGAIERLNTENKVKEVKEVKEYKGELMKYMVVLDTTNVGDRIKLDDREGGGDARGLPPRLHNFYIVEATTATQAKEIIMWTFQKSPGYIQRQIGAALKATPLGEILKTLDVTGKFWAYIAPKNTSRMPGQQAIVPRQKINPNNPDEVIPMTQPPLPPQTIVDNTADGVKEVKSQNPAAFTEGGVPTQNGNMNPEQMMQIMQMMMKMMGGQQPQMPVEPPKNPVTVSKVDNPENDPELMRRLQANSNNGPQHRNGEVPVDDPQLNEAERLANEEVTRFKSLDPEQQAAAARLDVDLNDNSDIDPDTFKKLVDRNETNEET